MIITPSASFIRPADTNAYTSGDLIANSTTAAAVIPMQFSLDQIIRRSGVIGYVRLYKSNPTVTNATFTLHLFTEAPTVTSGDNAALAVASARNHLGQIACDMSTGGLVATADVRKRFQILFGTNPAVFAFNNEDKLAQKSLFGLLVAAAAYTPASAETFAVTLEISDDDVGLLN
jgi:hypothetical protein